ncbi:MAG: NAD-dependent epimerase/dehydratase family protein [Rhodospirillales bacterium]|nr:NAD-dependent epimerase/dehydratase family protein [Rhodospirillales bacterium]
MKIEGGKFLLTGGASLIGSHIAEALLAAGAREIILFDNYSLGSPDTIRDLLADPRVKLVRGDILRVNELYDALEGVHGVFAAAGFLTLPLSLNPALGMSVNVMGQLNVYEACRYRGVGKVVFSSSVAVYSDPMTDVIAEDQPFAWTRLQPGGAIYGATKIIGENLGRLYHDRHGVQSIALRYASVYGERQHYRAVNALYIIETYDRLVRGEPPVIPDDGSEVHDYIHAADVARASVMAMQSDISRESFNVATGVSTSLNRLVEIVQQVMGTNLKPEYRTPVGKIRATASSHLHFSNEKIERMLGWRPEVSIEAGIRRVIEWRRANGG